jgi:DNA polymerase
MLLDPVPLPSVQLPFVDYAFPKSAENWNGLVLVGEAPGKEEVKQGMPFVGRSGRLLDEVLGESGIVRSHCLVANVFRYQPPGNKVEHFFASKRTASIENIALAEEWGKFGSLWCKREFSGEINKLAYVLQKWLPRAVVALGRTPLWALTGENGLLTKTGHVLDCRLAPKIPVIPTFHPSYILRGNWGKRPAWVSHFKGAAQYVSQK